MPILPASWGDSLRLGGLFLIAMWLALAISAVVTFRRAGTTPNPTKPTTALAFGGPYKFTRNPMYLGLFLLVLGTGFILNSIWPVLMAVPVLLVLRNAVILRGASAQFGAAYTGHKARVRRWL